MANDDTKTQKRDSGTFYQLVLGFFVVVAAVAFMGCAVVIYKCEQVPLGRHGIVTAPQPFLSPKVLEPGTFRYNPFATLDTLPTASDRDVADIDSCDCLDSTRLSLKFLVVNKIDDHYVEMHAKYYIPHKRNKLSDNEFFPYDIKEHLKAIIARECANMSSTHAFQRKTWGDKASAIAEELDTLLVDGLTVTDVILIEKPTMINRWWISSLTGDLDTLGASAISSIWSTIAWYASPK